MLGIIYRAYKDSITSDTERSKKASRLRSQGNFREAFRLEDKGERNYKIFFGTIPLLLEDFIEGTASENDARLRYIIGKLADCEKANNATRSVGLINQVIKTLLFYPPFSESLDSGISEKLKLDPDYILTLMHFFAAESYATLLNHAFYLRYFYSPSNDPENWDVVIQKFQEEQGVVLSEQKLQSITEARKENEKYFAAAMAELELIEKYLLPWPASGPMSWVQPILLRHEKIIQDKLIDEYRPEPEFKDSNLEYYEGILEFFKSLAICPPLNSTDGVSVEEHEAYLRYLEIRKRFFTDGWTRSPFEPDVY